MGNINAGGFTLEYSIKNESEVIITGCRGIDSVLRVPGNLTEGAKEYRVTGIGKKAFLGIKGLREVILPESVTDLEDWAFSQCIHMLSITIGCEPEKINPGRAIFEGCDRLERVYVGALKDEGLAGLLAAVVGKLPASYLLRDNDIGSPSWYLRWDMALTGFLHQDDIDGYSNAALCGEEDISYDGIGSVDGELLGESAAYLVGVCKNKCFLCLLRLKNSEKLSEATKVELEDYIRAHAKGKKTSGAWLVLKEDFKDNTEYFKLYLDIVKPDAKAFDEMLSDLKEDMAEVRAFLIRESRKDSKEDAFFSDLLI